MSIRTNSQIECFDVFAFVVECLIQKLVDLLDARSRRTT